MRIRERYRYRAAGASLIGLTALVALGSPIAAQDMPDTSVDAIRAYADGAEAYLARQYRTAFDHFARAHELDPTFITPVFMQMIVANNLGATSLSDSLEAVLQVNRYRMSDYYQGMFDSVVLRKQDLFAASSRTMHQVVERFPGTKAAYNYAYYDWVKHPEESLRVIEQLDPDEEPIRGWIGYFTVRSSILRTLGEFEAAFDNARAAQQRHPDEAATVAWEAAISAEMGDAQRAESAIARALEFPDVVPGVLFRNVGREFSAHGHEAEGGALLERALAWFETEDTRTGNTAKEQHASVLYELGRNGESRDIYRELAEAAPRNGGWQTQLAVTAALAGDRTTAEQILARVTAGEFGGNWQDRAGSELRIHAALGDVTAAKGALIRFGIRPLWVHRDPVLLTALGKDPVFIRFLATGK